MMVGKLCWLDFASSGNSREWPMSSGKRTSLWVGHSGAKNHHMAWVTIPGEPNFPGFNTWCLFQILPISGVFPDGKHGCSWPCPEMGSNPNLCHQKYEKDVFPLPQLFWSFLFLGIFWIKPHAQHPPTHLSGGRKELGARRAAIQELFRRGPASWWPPGETSVLNMGQLWGKPAETEMMMICESWWIRVGFGGILVWTISWTYVAFFSDSYPIGCSTLTGSPGWSLGKKRLVDGGMVHMSHGTPQKGQWDNGGWFFFKPTDLLGRPSRTRSFDVKKKGSKSQITNVYNR